MPTRKRDQRLYRKGKAQKGLIGLRLRVPPHVHAELKSAQSARGHQSLSELMADYLETMETITNVDRLPIPKMLTKTVQVKDLMVYIPPKQATFIQSIKDKHGYSPAAAVEALITDCNDPWSIRDQLTMFDLLKAPADQDATDKEATLQIHHSQDDAPARHHLHSNRKQLVTP